MRFKAIMNSPVIYLLVITLALLQCSQKTVKEDQNLNDSIINEDTLMTTIKIDSTISTEYLLGKFDPSKEENFVRIPTSITTKSNVYLREEALNAFIEMKDAAKADGLDLIIVSATRNYNSQKGIWEAKWNGARKVEGIDLRTIKDPVERAKMILLYSSMPGTSRHHWGTDIDINSVSPSYFESKKGKKIFQWLTENASSFGFCQTYTQKDSLRPNGYEEEKWHWSFIPISQHLTEQYKLRITYDMISDFKGSETAEKIDVINNYVLGINKSCL